MILFQNEIEVLLSVLSDTELIDVRERVERMIRERVYEEEEFPLSLGGLRWMVATIEWSYWGRRGKGVRIEEGKVVVCELGESPFYLRYEERRRESERRRRDDGAGAERGADEDKIGESGEGTREESGSESEEGEWI